MKRRFIISAILFLLFLPCSYAQQLKAEQTALRVIEYIHSNGIISSSLKRRLQIQDMKLADTRSDLYVFNLKDGGYVIASSSEKDSPVLGYVPKGYYNRYMMPDALIAIIDSYEASVENVQLYRATDNAVKKTIRPLMKTQWGQGEPYNLLCPEVEGIRCVTGCVATAIAQILFYYRQPTTSKTIYPYRTSSYKLQMKSLPATDFEWELMQKSYDYNSSEESRQAVAKLMLYCGCAFSMDYAPDGSGADTTPVCDGIPFYFGYDSSMKQVSRKDYGIEDWESLIYEQLSNSMPVLYSGRTKSDNGHAFVCDGYDNGLFHINWGWEGYCDSWFSLSLLSPANKDNDKDGYSESQQAVINFKPQGWTPEDIVETETVVTVKNYSRQYGDANPLFEYTVEGEPLVGTPKIGCNANEKSSVGEYTVSIERGTVENVNVKFVNGKLDVKKAPLTISTGTYTIKQGEALPEYTLTYSGFKNDETCSVLLKQPIVECDATPLSEAGEYPIRIYGAEAQNYEIDYVNGMLIIDEKPELAKLQLPLGNGENMCFWEPGFGSEWYIVKGKIDIRFTDEGIFYLHKYIIDGNQYDGFVIVFEKPVSQSGLSVRASNNTYEIPVGTSSIEGQFRRNTWDDFSLRAEVGQDVTIKNVLLKNINGEYENANYVIHHMPDQTLHWNVDGVGYSSAIKGTLYTNKNVEILNTYSGNVNLEEGESIGGVSWSAKRDAEKPMIYKLILTESLSSGSSLSWRLQTVSGKTLYFPIDGDNLEYEISVDDDVADCRIINQEGSLLWFQIEGVYLENGETTGVMQARKDLPVDGKVYNLQGQKVSPVGRGLYIRNNKKIIRK